MSSSPQQGRRRLVALVAAAFAVIAGVVAIVALRGEDAPAPRSPARVMRAPSAPRPTLPDDAAGRRARLEGLRYLELAESGTVAVIDDTVDKRSYFASVAGAVLSAKVTAITVDNVTLDDPLVGRIVLPHRGREHSPPAHHPQMEVRAEDVPVHYAPGVDPAKVAADQAMVEAYIASRPHGGGGGGGGGGGNGGGRGRNKGAAGGGQGSGMDPALTGGPGRQRRLRAQAEQRDTEDE
jgi:hypothetical protein